MGSGEKSPIFSISSPSSTSPVVYAGTSGRVYELEVSELDKSGLPIDPYFAVNRDLATPKRSEPLSMFESNGRDDERIPGSMPRVLWKQHPGEFRPERDETKMYTGRLDERWQH
jgi:hypothetical protein